MRHSHRFWGLGCGHLWGATTLPTQHARGSNVDPVRLCPSEVFLGVRGLRHEVQVCLSACRWASARCFRPPPPRPGPASPVVELASYSGPLHLAHRTSSVCNAFPLPCLAGQFIHPGPSYPRLCLQETLTPAWLPTPVPRLWPPLRNIFQSLQSGSECSSSRAR